MADSPGEKGQPDHRSIFAAHEETMDLLHRVQGNFALAISGLAWAVGHLEATGDADNYASRVLEQLSNPVVRMEASTDG